MKKVLLIIIVMITSLIVQGQVKDTIFIDNIEYEVIIDTLTHQVRECWVIERETFIEKLYIGFSTPVNYGNYKQEIIYDASEYGKISLGYDFGHNAITIGAYISLGRLHKRRDKINRYYH